MNRILCCCLGLLALSVAASDCPISTTDGPEPPQSASDFERDIVTSPLVVLVRWHNHREYLSAAMMSPWEKIAATFKGRVQLVSYNMDTSKEYDRGIQSTFNVTGLPTWRLYTEQRKTSHACHQDPSSSQCEGSSISALGTPVVLLDGEVRPWSSIKAQMEELLGGFARDTSSGYFRKK